METANNEAVKISSNLKISADINERVIKNN